MSGTQYNLKLKMSDVDTGEAAMVQKKEKKREREKITEL